MSNMMCNTCHKVGEPYKVPSCNRSDCPANGFGRTMAALGVVERSCNTCAHRDRHGMSQPCRNCTHGFGELPGHSDHWQAVPAGVLDREDQTFRAADADGERK